MAADIPHVSLRIKSYNFTASKSPMPSALLVKNMVCSRCIMTVEDILRRTGITYDRVLLGEIQLPQPLTAAQKEALIPQLQAVGFELIDSHSTILIEKAKQLIIRRARCETDAKDTQLALSRYLSDHLHYEYTHLSSMFSSVEGRTIEQYYIEQRIERAKELLVYGQMTLSEIAQELGYSSVSHLSAQFKKITGLTPSHFREVGASRRQSLDRL